MITDKIKLKINHLLKKILRSRGKNKFISTLGYKSLILDVGCGNNSPFLVKSVLPNASYVGLDVGDHNQTKPNLADEYIVTSPENFANEIQRFKQQFDAVISCHNLEHCNDRLGTFVAMLNSLKAGGSIYISFPCEQSVSFPCRSGTLNYYDDITHLGVPPDFQVYLSLLEQNKFTIEFSTRQYKPFILFFLGMLLEPYFKLTKKAGALTWAYYGFESIIWAKKIESR